MDWSRLELLIGKNQMKQLQNKTVVVIGVGGVGGYAVEALARSGIGTIILIDADTIEKSNINRQLIALHSTLKLKKTVAWKNRIHDINPHCKVIAKDVFLTKQNIKEEIPISVDYIIDACDTLDTKKELIRFSVHNHIKFIASMGMGNKIEPSKIIITELSQTSYDPIAKILRKMVRDEQIKKKIMVVSSTEQPIVKHETIASNAFVPAVAGLLCASYVVRDIVGEI